MTRFQIRRKLKKACSGTTLTGFYVRKKLLKAGTVATFVAVGAGTLGAGQAQAVVVTFDDVRYFDGDHRYTQRYAGLNWDNFAIFDSESFMQRSGFKNGKVSNPNVAFNVSGDPARVSISSGKFDFNSAYLTGAWSNGLNILVEGFLGGESLYSKIVTVDSTAPTKLNFDFLGIDNLKFSPSGGVDAGYDGGPGTYFAMDNFTYNETKPVPEPLTVLGSLTAGSIGAALRRKYNQQQKDTAKV